MAKQETPKTVYRFGDGVYLNITNRCPNLCAFCIKTKWRMDFHGNNLNLEGNEPSANDVVAALDAELKKLRLKKLFSADTANLPCAWTCCCSRRRR